MNIVSGLRVEVHVEPVKLDRLVCLLWDSLPDVVYINLWRSCMWAATVGGCCEEAIYR